MQANRDSHNECRAEGAAIGKTLAAAAGEGTEEGEAGTAVAPEDATTASMVKELEGQVTKVETQMGTPEISKATKYGLKRQLAILKAKLKKARGDSQQFNSTRA